MSNRLKKTNKSNIQLYMEYFDAIDITVNETVVEANLEKNEKLMDLLRTNYSFYLKVFNKTKKIKNRMISLYEAQIHSTGIELIDLLTCLHKAENPVFLTQKIVDDLSTMLYECMLLEICYKKTHFLFDVVKKSKIPFSSIEKKIKEDLFLENIKNDFSILKDLDEELLMFLGNRKMRQLKENYLLQVHLYDSLNRDYLKQEDKEIIFKIKDVKKKKNRIKLQQWKRFLFGLFCLGIVNLGLFNLFLDVGKDGEFSKEKNIEYENFTLLQEDNLLSHNFFFSGTVIFDLFSIYIIHLKMKTEPFEKDNEEIEKTLCELECALEREINQKKQQRNHLIERKEQLDNDFQRLPLSIQEEITRALRKNNTSTF